MVRKVSFSSSSEDPTVKDGELPWKKEVCCPELEITKKVLVVCFDTMTDPPVYNAAALGWVPEGGD